MHPRNPVLIVDVFCAGLFGRKKEKVTGDWGKIS
jgi:hypothetical protein